MIHIFNRVCIQNNDEYKHKSKHYYNLLLHQPIDFLPAQRDHITFSIEHITARITVSQASFGIYPALHCLPSPFCHLHKQLTILWSLGRVEETIIKKWYVLLWNHHLGTCSYCLLTFLSLLCVLAVQIQHSLKGW